MSPRRLSLLYAVLSLAGGLVLTGCAGPMGLFQEQEAAPSFRDPAMSVQAASDKVVIGKSSKADVLAALGSATVIVFDSGFEVWAYRVKGAQAQSSRAEFVVLFSPDGVVRKTRIRPSYPLR